MRRTPQSTALTAATLTLAGLGAAVVGVVGYLHHLDRRMGRALSALSQDEFDDLTL